MFKSNPNINEYYGLIHQIKRKSKKLKRTECSNQKLEYSKKSFSQDSQSEGQISLSKKKLHLQHFLTHKQTDNHNKNHFKLESPESPKEQNILDLFKKKDSEGQNILKKSVDLYPEARSKKYIGINYNQNVSNKNQEINPARQYELREYFGDSIDIKNLKLEKNSSKSRSLRNKSQKSPLRRILKSKSRQQLYTPVQKMCNIIKQEQKAREQRIQNEKTLKHVNYYRTLNQLNETYMNYPLKTAVSQKNLYEISPQSNKKKKKNNNLNVLKIQQLSQSKQYKQSKGQYSRNHQNHSKKMKSESDILFQVCNKNKQKNKISSSKIKKYFNKKQESEKDKMKMKHLLQNISTKNNIAQLRKVQSQRALPYMTQSYDSQISQSIVSKQSNSKNQMYSDQKIPYQSRLQDSNYQQSSMHEYSDYGFQAPETYQKVKNQQKKIHKTPKKAVNFQDQDQIPQSPAGEMIDQIKSFQESNFNEFISQSDLKNNQINSVASIQDEIPSQRQKYQKESYISSQPSKRSSQCKINVHGPSNSFVGEQFSVNTPAYRHNRNEKKPKQSIISKLKKDIEDEKMKSSKRLKIGESKLSNKKKSQVFKKQLPSSSYLSSNKESKQQNTNNFPSSGYTDSQNNIKLESKGSNIHELSNLINIQRDYHSPEPPKLKQKISLKQSISRLKRSKISNQEKSKVQNSQRNGHLLSEFQSLVNSKKQSSQFSEKSQYKIQSMINSNKLSKSKEQQSSEIQSQITSSKKSSSYQQESNEINSPSKKQDQKKVIKFLKVTKKIQSPNVIPKMQESNLQSLTDSYQADSIASSQATHLISSATITQSIKFPNSYSPQKNTKNQSKSSIIQEEQASENQSAPSQSSSDMSSSASAFSKSQKQQQSLKKKISNSEYSESGQSRTITNNNKTSRISSSENNLNLNLNSKSQFSLSNSTPNDSNSVSNKTSLISSASNKKFATANKFNTLPKNDSNMFKKKKNFAEYTLNDVARFIEEHEFRIEAFCLYIDNSKNAYEEDYELQKIELLSFLMLKKNLYELNKAINALQGKGENVFHLTDIQILDEVLQDYMDRQQIRQQLNNMIKEQKQTRKQLKETHESLQKKYNGEKGFNLNLDKDDFSSQIVKKLGHQLNTLYQKWQQNKSDGDRITAQKLSQKYQKRMMEIIELIFLTSQLDGKNIKPCQLILQSQLQFRSYYEKWFERIIQTIEYFDAKSKCDSN